MIFMSSHCKFGFHALGEEIYVDKGRAMHYSHVHHVFTLCVNIVSREAD